MVYPEVSDCKPVPYRYQTIYKQMILLSFLHFFCILAYISLAVFVFYKTPKSILNRSCAVLMACFAIWNFADIFPAGYDLSKDTAKLFQNISSIGWIGFPIALCYFSLAFAKKEDILRKNFIRVITLIIPLFFIYKQWTNCLAINHVQQYYGWVNNWSDTIWPYLFYAYYISFTILAIYFIYRYWRKTEKLFEKKQAKIIVASVCIGLVGGTIFDVVIPKLNVQEIPSLANVFLLIFTVAVVYAIIKYKFLSISPAVAAENIISSIEEFLLLLDQDGFILTVNKATLDSLKYKQKELEGKSVGMLFSKGSLKRDLLEKITKGEIVKNYETDFLAKNGKEIPILFSSSPLKNEEGNISGIIFIARDITERKQAEEKEKRHLANIALLSQAAVKYVTISPGENIYDYIRDVLKNLTGAKYVIINSYNKTSNTLTSESFYADKTINNQITKLLGKKVEGYTMEPDDRIFKELLRKEKLQVPGGLFELSGEKIPRAICHSIELLLDVENVYAMGLSVGDELYGSAVLLLRRGEVLENADIIDTFINQTSIVLQRKQAEEALKKSEKRFRKLGELLPETVYEMDAHGVLTFVNKNAFDDFGYTQEDFAVGLNVLDMIIPDDRGRASENIQKIIKGENIGSNEFTMQRKDGSTFPATIHSTVIIHDGKVAGLRGIIVNITERKQVEKMVQDIIEKNPMSIQIVDKEGFTLKVNSAHTLLFGGVPPPDFSFFNDSQLIQQGFKELIERIKNGEVVRFPDVRYNPHDSVSEFPDTPVWVRTVVFPLFDSNGKPERFVFMHENITDRKQEEETLRRKDEHYKAIIENIFKFIPEGVLVFTESMSLLKQNKAFGDIIRKYAPVLGYTEEELAQKIIEQLSSKILNGKKTEIRISIKSQ